MAASLLLLLVAVLLNGMLLSSKELPVISGSVLASGAGEVRSVKILFPIMILGGIAASCLLPDPVRQSAVQLTTPAGAGLILAVCLATVAATLACMQFSRFPAAALAFMGALAGAGRAFGTPARWDVTSSYIISWIFAPLLCAALAAAGYRVCKMLIGKKSSHIALLEARMLRASFAASLVLIAAFALNNATLLSLFPAASLSGIAAAGIAVGGTLLAFLLTFRHSEAEMSGIADNDLDVNSQSTLSVLISMALVFLLFSTPLPGLVGLTPTPLPAGTLFAASLAGISLARKRALIDGEELVKSLFAALLAPLIGALAGYSLGRILDGDIVNTLIVLGLAALAVAITAYMRWQAARDLQRQIFRTREQQVDSARKSLSALEVKAEMTEKDLSGKLDLKRQELVDFAVGISDQKKFMENTYEDLKKIRKMPDGPDKDASMDKMLGALRERMYFSREMNDFYARSEVLHKDFNMRLSEAFPKLTENERKLANLLRQGFSSKYIASLMNITPKSVEINRYRLRSKLGLQREDNLVQFIKSI